MGIIIVEVCTDNFLGSLDLEQLEADYPEVAVIRTQCLGHCALCRARPYAMVNDKRIYAGTAEECLRLVREAIEEELAVFYGANE
jgi:uncharacterized protein YuzB (UPF0349 family)